MIETMNTPILGLDPGPTHTGMVMYHPDGNTVSGLRIMPNHDLLNYISKARTDIRIAIEMIAHYGSGMPAGKSVFETCIWIGRFYQAWDGKSRYSSIQYFRYVFRKDVKIHLCGSMKAKDANIRQALLDRFPATGGGSTPQIGVKKKPGPLYGMKSHLWAALAVAITANGLWSDLEGLD